MWRIKLFINIFLFLFLGFACDKPYTAEIEINKLEITNGLTYYQSELFTGKGVKYFYKSNQKEFEKSYKKGLLGGRYIQWYENGNKKKDGFYIYHSKIQYSKNKKTLINRSHSREKITKFINKFSNGIFKTWYPSGVLKSKDIYLNGLLNGKSLTWYSNGLRKSIIFYKNGLKDGDSIKFDKKKLIEWKFFKRGKFQYEHKIR